MLGTAYKMKIYTKANTAIETLLHALDAGVGEKLNDKLFPHLHFVLWHFLGLFLCDTAPHLDIHSRSRFCFRIWIFSLSLHQKILNLSYFSCLRGSPCPSRSLHNFVIKKCINILPRVTLFFKFATRFRMKNITNQVFSNIALPVHKTYF